MIKDIFTILFVIAAMAVIVVPYASYAIQYILDHAQFIHGLVSYLLLAVAMAVSDAGGKPQGQ